MDIALALEALVPAASYQGSLTANTRESFDKLRWLDDRAKPSWDDLVRASNAVAVQTQPTAKDQREAAYAVEADEFLKQAEYYEAEEKGFRYLEDLANAAIAEAKAREYFKQYATKKAEIRARFPDQPLYLLNSTGTYHAEGCSHITETAERLTLEQIASRGTVKPCTRCNAPAVAEETPIA